MDKLIKEEKPKTIKLGGREFTLSPINLSVMCHIEEEFDCSFSELQKVLVNKKTKEATSTLKLIYALVKDNYPELTMTELGKLIVQKNIESVAKAVTEALSGE